MIGAFSVISLFVIKLYDLFFKSNSKFSTALFYQLTII